MQRLLWFSPFFLLILTCSPKIKYQFVDEIAPLHGFIVPENCEGNSRSCRNKLNYIPDTAHLDHTMRKTLRVNFHIMCKADSTYNFNHKDARSWIKDILYYGNMELEKNHRMRLPIGHNDPLLDSQFRIKLAPLPNDPNDDGIYHHYDDELFFMIAKGKHVNHHNKEVFAKYAIQEDSVMNVFVMGVHPDSIGSPTFKPFGRGIAFGRWLKVGGWHYGFAKVTMQDGKLKPARPAWFACREFKHEVMHNLGLRHTWRYNDGCDDTPKNPNCWNKSDTPPCDSLWGNNIMDYNAFQIAISPCQIGTIHYNLSKLNYSVRPMLERTWCRLNPKKTITIRDTVAWNSAKDLEGNLVIADGGMLIMRCRVSIPPGGKITIAPKGHLILDGAQLHNDCGLTWEGIEVQRLGKIKGQIDLLSGASVADTPNSPKLLTQEQGD